MANSDPSRSSGYPPAYSVPGGASPAGADSPPPPPLSVQPAAGQPPASAYTAIAYPPAGYPMPGYAAPPQPIPVGKAHSAVAGNRPLPITPKTSSQPSARSSGYPVPQPISAAGQRAANRPIVIAAGATPIGKPTPEDEAAAADEKPMQVLRSAPPWLVSLIVHVVLMLFLAIAFFTPQITQPVEFTVEVKDEIYAEEIGEQLIDNVLDTPLSDITVGEASLTPSDLPPVDDPLAAPPQVDLQLEGNGFSSDITAPNIGLALSGRQAGSGKNTLLAAYGGTATTESSVKAGLVWLQKNQNKDGSWSLIGPYQNGGSSENRNAATAMALLAFQGAGHTDTTGEFAKVVDKGWHFLLKQQGKSGSFVPSGTPDHQSLYTHAQATIALCELYGMTKNSKYREAAQRAVDFCVDTQSPEGGWRYQPKHDADMSVTGWFVMALQSAMMAKLEVPSTTLEDVRRFLDSVALEEGRRYSYRAGSFETSAVSAEGLLCRQYLGWQRDDPRLVDGVERLVGMPVNYSDQNVYYWYYATQAAHHMEGQLWDRWNRVMRQEVPTAQVKSGPEAGSWSPTNDEWGARGAGRLFTTCLSIYMLEVYYRHLPIYAEVYKYKLQQF